jgi:hypothetical protein
VHAEVGVTTLSSPIFIPVKGAPEDSPVAMSFHSNRWTQEFFGGGQDVFHFGVLLFLNDYRFASSGSAADEESCCLAKPVMRLAGRDGSQDEQQGDGSHDQSPYQLLNDYAETA